MWFSRAAQEPARLGPDGELRTRASDSDSGEAAAALAALRRGIGATILGGVLLVSAVACTWYAPTDEPGRPGLQVGIRGTTECGFELTHDADGFSLLTKAGPVSLTDLEALLVRPVASCP